MPDDGIRRLETALKHLENNEDIPEKNKSLIIKFVQQLSAEGIKRTRQLKYIYYLMRLSKTLNKNFDKATKEDIIKLINDLENGYSLWIKRKEKPLSEWAKHDFRVTLKRFYKWLREQEGQEFGRGEYPKEVKWFSVSMKRERKILPRQMLDENDLERLLQKTTNARDRCFIFLLYESGCRISELLDLRIKDIDKDQFGKKITVHGKTGERVVRIIDAAPPINIWLKEHPLRSEGDCYFFCGINGQQRGKPVDDSYFRILLHKLGKEANIRKPLNPHHFRHSACSRYANKLTESQMCEYFGWVQGSQEARTYVHLSGRDIDDAILTMHGKKQKKIEEIKIEPKICPQCKTVNDHLANLCQVCGLGLDRKSIMEYDQQKEWSAEFGTNMRKLLKNRDFLVKLLNIIDEERVISTD